jgi:hypothetical protein
MTVIDALSSFRELGEMIPHKRSLLQNPLAPRQDLLLSQIANSLAEPKSWIPGVSPAMRKLGLGASTAARISPL